MTCPDRVGGAQPMRRPPYAFMLYVSERGIELGGSFIRNIDYRAGHPERFTVSYAVACYTFVVSYGA